MAPAARETLTPIRRRLKAAVKQSGKVRVVRRTEDQLYFWLSPASRRRGRPKKHVST